MGLDIGMKFHQEVMEIVSYDITKEKKQSNYTNPDPWARIVGSRNTAATYIDGTATTTLYDSGPEIQLMSKEFCEGNNLKIHPIEKLTECSTMNGSLLGYDGYVEVNVQIPGRDFSEDHLFLATFDEISHQKEIPVVVGTCFCHDLEEILWVPNFCFYYYICQICCLRLGLRSSGFTHD